MNPTPRPNAPEATRRIFDEADIGSGEKNPAQQETEEMIRQIPPLPASSTPSTGGDTKPRAPQ